MRTARLRRVSAPVSGWYPDPRLPATLRWWDGTQWTDRTQPVPGAGNPADGQPFRPPLPSGWGTLSKALQGCLALSAAAAAFVIASNLYIVDVYRRIVDEPGSVDDGTAERADLLSILQAVEFPVLLVTGVLFIVWLYQAHRSDHMDPQLLQHKSGWAIGGWFVPILNLWRPYQMVSDVRRGSTCGRRAPRRTTCPSTSSASRPPRPGSWPPAR